MKRINGENLSAMKREKGGKRVTAGWLRKIGVKEVLISGMIVAAALGWAGWKNLGPSFYGSKQAFPETGIVRVIIDGDTFELQNGVRVRTIGINAPTGDAKSKDKLANLVEEKRVWLEYDRYQDDKYGRVLAWVWTDCEDSPHFLPADYMHLSNNQSRPGLMDSPVGCKKGELVQEEMIKAGLAKVELYKDRGELKYQKRLLTLEK